MEKENIKKIALILIFLFLIVLALNFLNKKSGILNNFKGFFYSISQSIQKPLWQAGDDFSDFFKGISQGKKIKQENEKLKADYENLLFQNIAIDELKKENDYLRKALELGLNEEFKLVLAQVISKDISQDSILINKGLKDGLSQGMTVITEQKVLLGKVAEVSDKFSRVILISNSESFFPVTIQAAQATGIIRGRGNGQLSLEEIPQDKEIKEDDIVLTTSLGGNFPRGLLVGKIKNIKKSDTEPFQKAEVYSFLKIDDIKTVFAVTSF
jgi:rod shape-determining protein MreC